MLTADAQETMVAALAGVASHVSVHTAIPSAAGSNEVSGGSYARQTVSWVADGDGVRDNSGTVTHDIPGGTTVVAYGWWSALTGGTHYGHALIGGTLSGAGCADASTDTITAAGHGLSDGDRVAAYGLGGSLPAGLAEGTLYHVVGSTADTFQLATSAGGSAVDITAGGELWWADCVPETYGSDGQLEAAAGGLTLDATTL